MPDAERRLSPTFGNAVENRGRLVDGVVEVVAPPGQRQVDGSDREVYPGPPLRLGEGEVGARHGVGDVRLGLDSAGHANSKRPKGGEDAIDGVILAVALSKGCFTRLVVDERQPALRQGGRERRERQDLGDNLEDVDERLASYEVVEEPVWHLPVVVEGRDAQPEDQAPAVTASRRRRGRSSRRSHSLP